MVSVGQALEFPTNGDGWIKTVLIGGVLSILGSFLLLPLIPVQGYFVQVLRSATEGSTERPAFEDWGTLFVDGLKILGVQLVYGILPFVVVAIGVTVSGIGLGVGGTGGSAVGAVGGLVLLLGALSFLAAVYLIPAAVANMAHENSFGAAFDVSTLVSVGSSADYLVGVLVAIAVGLVLGLVAGALSLVVVGVFLAFYVQVVTYHIFGQAYAAATGSDQQRPTRTGPEQTEAVGWE